MDMDALPDAFDAIVVGTGLVESMLAAALVGVCSASEYRRRECVLRVGASWGARAACGQERLLRRRLCWLQLGDDRKLGDA